MILQVYDSNNAWLRAAISSIMSVEGDEESLHLCLSGGMTPRPVYEELARNEAFRTLVASKAVHLWVGDEREAPEHSGLRNSEMIAEIFANTGFDFKNIHVWPAGSREYAAAVYERQLLAHAEKAGLSDRPWFDLVVLGVGQDGHTAGLFTEKDIRRGREDHGSAGKVVLLTEAPQEPKRRMTMAPRALLSSRKILVLMQGLSKMRLLMANLFGERADPIRHFLLDRCEVIAQL